MRVKKIINKDFNSIQILITRTISNCWRTVTLSTQYHCSWVRGILPLLTAYADGKGCN